MSDASFNQQQQEVETQYNAGRDQVFHNFFIVGQFLDFANIQGLIPKQEPTSDFSSIIEAFESSFSERLESDLVDGISFVGEVLNKTVLEFIPQNHSALPAITDNHMLEKIFGVITSKIYEMNYQIHFSEKVYLTEEGFYSGYDEKILWLESLRLLWSKHFHKDEKYCKYGLLWHPNNKYPSMINITKSKYYKKVSFDELSIEQTRVMMVGLMIDLLRLYTMGTSHLKFWKSLVDLLTKDYKKVSSDQNDSEKSA